MPDARLSYCAAEVRRLDYDRYLTAITAPADRREALFALYAFNVEIARTREVVSEPLLGQIRLQWWRESIESLFAGEPRRHGVVEPLGDAVRRFGLGREALDALIDAREADLDDRSPASLAELEAYAEETAGRLAALALGILGPEDATTGAAVRDVAVAWGLVGLLRSVPFHAAARRLHLPDDLLAAEGAERRDIFELRPSEATARVVATVAGHARSLLERARLRREETDRRALPVLLPAAIADRYLARLAANRHEVLRTPVDVGPLRRQWSVVRAAMRGRY